MKLDRNLVGIEVTGNSREIPRCASGHGTGAIAPVPNYSACCNGSGRVRVYSWFQYAPVDQTQAKESKDQAA